MTKFSFEVPIAHLDDFDDLQDFHFCLSMLFSDQRYRNYHHEVSRRSLKTIWIDNSFNEKFIADKAHDLLYWYRQMNAAQVVAPDSIEWTTEEIRSSWVDMARHVGPNHTILVLRNHLMYLDLKLLYPRIVAVSYWKRPGMPSAEWSLTELQKVKRNQQLHFLGLNNVQELITVKPQSCDTSMPIKIALKDQTLKQWIEAGCPHINTKDLGFQGQSFFNQTMSQEQINLARRNIIQLKSLLGDETCLIK